ncbi:MAG: TIGR00282 family metallophosphoesterase [Planctomycetes bacterium]|nr:TIGR00282 family metallophosphoesterase [Planctomycetota bacterium]
MDFRALFIGDIVGKPGRRAVAAALPQILAARPIDVIIANAENAAGGSGISPAIFEELRAMGVDCVTMGDHVYRKKEAVPLLAESDRILRPANLAPEAVGRGYTVLASQSGFPFAVVSLLGRTFMKPSDCPYHAADRILAELGERVKLIFVDMHAEATSDKVGMGWHLDGRVTAVVGTHTHVQTADERVLPRGTAHISDLGMTGAHDGILGRKKEKVLSAVVTGMPTYFDVAVGDLRVCGAVVTADTQTGRALAIERVMVSIPEPAARAAPPPAGAPTAEAPEPPEPAESGDSLECP